MHEPLAHDVTNRIREPLPQLLLLVLAEHSEDAVDGLSRIDRVHRREDDVTGLGRRHRDLHRGAVANFADQNYFRRLPERGAQAVGEIREILSELALIEERLLVRMQKLDRVLQGQNMNFLRHVELVQHRGERRRFSAAGGARHENDAVLFLDHFPEDRRQPELIERGDFGLELAHDDGLPAILLENVHAKPGEIGEGIAAIA